MLPAEPIGASSVIESPKSYCDQKEFDPAKDKLSQNSISKLHKHSEALDDKNVHGDFENEMNNTGDKSFIC